MEYKKVMIAFEEHDQDNKVLSAAIDVAERYGAELTLLHVNEIGAGYPSPVDGHIEHRYTEEELSEVVSKVNANNYPVTILLAKASGIRNAVVEQSKACDLLVLGHRHMSFLASSTSDSTDEDIVNELDCHALVIPLD